jgi:hypothetical protein
MELDVWIFMYTAVKGFGLKQTRLLNLLEKFLCQIVHKVIVERVKSLDSIFSSQLKYS